MATLSELINETLNKETPGIIIPEGSETDVPANISNIGGTLPKLKIWFITEQNTLSAQITSNPTESGRVQNDNIILEPAVWNIRAKVTDVMGQFSTADKASLAGNFIAAAAPDTAPFFRRAGAGVSNSVYDYLFRLREARRPFTIVTSFGRVKDLFFDSISFERDKDTANSLPIQMSLRELFISNSIVLSTTETVINPTDDARSVAESENFLGQQQPVEAQ